MTPEKPRVEPPSSPSTLAKVVKVLLILVAAAFVLALLVFGTCVLLLSRR
jgi:hypothetical protein